MCHTRFDSALQMDEATFAEVRMVSMIERCASCRFASKYQRDDYYFAPVSESA
jgi:hypothetical protein